MRPMNAMTPEQVLAFKRNVKRSAKPVAKAKTVSKAKPSKPKSGWRHERLIEQRYSNPEPGIHILDVPCYLWTPNEILGLLDMPFEVARKKKKLLKRDKADASQAVLGSLARYLPKHCLDKSLRSQFKRVVLSRVSVGVDPLDDDNNQGALKYVRDTLCGWIIDGPLLSFDKADIGGYDKIVRTPVNPHGYIDMIYDQDIRTRQLHGCVIELSTREWE